jgi:hypothetical protein
LNGAAANAAADDLEARAAGERGQPRRRSKLSDRETPGIELTGDLRAAEHDAQREVDPFVAKESVLDSKPELETASIGGNAIFDCSAHQSFTPPPPRRAALRPSAIRGAPHCATALTAILRVSNCVEIRAVVDMFDRLSSLLA